MELFNKNAEIYVPDGVINEKALRRTTHMAIGAHQDDIEIMAYDGILKCLWPKRPLVFCRDCNKWRKEAAVMANISIQAIPKCRQFEPKNKKKRQIMVNMVALFFLNYSSSDIKNPKNRNFIEDIKQLIIMAKPEVIYTHNLADKHDTHVSTAVKVIQALRELDKSLLPEKNIWL